MIIFSGSILGTQIGSLKRLKKPWLRYYFIGLFLELHSFFQKVVTPYQHKTQSQIPITAKTNPTAILILLYK